MTRTGGPEPGFGRVALLLIGASLVYCLPLFADLDNRGRQDWDQFTFRYETPRVALLRDRVPPTWNPYANGGTVLLAHPHSPVLSPWYLLVLVLGAPIGLRVQVLLFMALGAVGMAALAGRLGATRTGCVAGGIVYMMSSHFALHIAEGHLEWCVLGLMPWLAVCLLRTDEGARHVFIAALLLASVLTFGAVYVPVIFLPFFSSWVALRGLQTRQVQPLLKWMAVVALAVLLSSAKLLPSLAFASDARREVSLDQRTPRRALLTALFDPRQAFLYKVDRDRDLPEGHFARAIDVQEAAPAVERLNRLGLSDGFHEYGSYVGAAGILLAGWGIIRTFRGLWPLYAAGALALVVALGAESPVDLWSVLRRLPPYDQLHVPSRFLAALVFTLAVAAAMGTSAPRGGPRGSDRVWRVGAVLLVVALYAEVAAIGWNLFRDVFVLPPVTLPAHAGFAQRYRARFDAYSGEHVYGAVMKSSMYAHLTSNSGTLDAYENLSLPPGDVLTTADPGYRGEAYLERGRGSAEILVWTMSRVVVRVVPDFEVNLVLNQNYYRGWRARRRDAQGRVDVVDAYRSRAGLIAVAVSPHHREVELFYRPDKLAAGLSISGATLVLCGIGLWLSGRASSRWPRRPRGSPPGPAQ